jgi:hypothetical protein
MTINRKHLPEWTTLILVISSALALGQTSPGPGKPKTTDTSQDKTQKTLPGKNPSPTPQAQLPTKSGATAAQSPGGTPQKTPLGPAALQTVPITKTPANSSPNAQPFPGYTKVVDGNTLTKDQFRALPANAVIQEQGKKVTKQELLNQAPARLQATSSASRHQRMARFIEVRNRFLQKQQSDLKARDNKVLAEFARRKAGEELFIRSTQYVAIRNQALDLQAQYAQASPAEKPRLELQARELQKQLKNLKTANLY